MVSARRRRRRRPRWLFLLLLLTAVVLAVNAAASSRSHGPGRRLAQLSYADAMRPEIERSTQEGADLVDVQQQAAKLGSDGVGRRLTQVARDANAVLRAVEDAKPPASLRTAHSLLLSTMYIRAKQAAAVQGALVAALGDDPSAKVVESMASIGADLVTADRTYDVFLRALPSLQGGTNRVLPPSHWVDDPSAWSAPSLAVFLQSLRASTISTPVHDVAVVIVTIDPAAVGTDNGSSVLPPTKTLHMQIVVGNVGNAAEKHVPVTATLTTATGASETVHDTVDLTPGQRTTVLLGGLRTVPDDRSILTVLVGPAPGETATADNSKIIPLVVKPG
jgi:hypothetical protein